MKLSKAFLIYIAIGAIIGIVAGISVIVRGYADPVSAGISNICDSTILLLFVYVLWTKKRAKGWQDE